jgi:hypothetical protein
LISLATVCIALVVPASARGQLLPPPAALADAPAELIQRLRADPFTYFRFINRVWTARVCEAFADLSDVPTVRLHGDAHVEQFALTSDAWGLDDFDDSTSGPGFATSIRSSARSISRPASAAGRAIVIRSGPVFRGYRRGCPIRVSPSRARPRPSAAAEVPVARDVRVGGRQMRPMDAAHRGRRRGHGGLRSVGASRPSGPAATVAQVVRAGWLHLGVAAPQIGGSDSRAGPTLLPKTTSSRGERGHRLEGVACVEGRATLAGVRIIDGSRQLGRLKHESSPSDRRCSSPRRPAAANTGWTG